MKDLSPGLPLPALHLVNNPEQPLTSGPAVQGNHGNLSCPAEEKNKIPGVGLSHLRPSNSFPLQLTPKDLPPSYWGL